MKRLTHSLPIMLAAALQVLPLLRNIVTSPAAGSTFAFILRWGIGTGAVLGSVDAVSGATSVFTSPSTFNGSVGNYFSNNVVVSIGGGNTASSRDYTVVSGGGTSSPALSNGQTTTIAMPPGLTFQSSWVNGARTIGGVIYGTPTTGGTYPATVTIVSPGNASLSQNITLNISGAIAPTAPAITSQPAAASVNAGNNVTFTVTASGTGPLGYYWQKNGIPIANGGNISGANTATLNLNAVTPTDAGNYSVIVSNSVGTVASTSAALTVLAPPVITTQPVAQSAAVGGSAQFSVTASGTAPLTYSWLKNGSAIANGANYSGANSSVLNIASVTSADAGTYSVKVTNPAGSTTSSGASLSVVSSPVVATPPSSLTVATGGGASFTVVAAGSAPLTYQWLKNGTPLANGGNVSGATTAVLSLSSVGTGDQASYSVVVSNNLGTVTSPGATLTVAAPPVIVTQPAGATILAGGSASLSVTASGTGPLAYQWQKNGTKIPGATTATLTVNSASATDAGNYSVTVSNVAGSVTSGTAVLTVQSPPVIVTQPTDQIGGQGSPVSLSVTVAGTAPLSYQWFQNGAAIMNGGNISGANSSVLTIAALSNNEVGTYFVAVSNAFGTVTSASAGVSINIAPVITVNPVSQSVTPDATVTLTVKAAGSSPLVYQWFKNGHKLQDRRNTSGSTTAVLTLTHVNPRDGGLYSVNVANSHGSVSSAPATLTVQAPPVITGSPKSRTMKAGGKIAFSVRVKGGNPLNYQWFKNGSRLQDGPSISGATSRALKLSAITTNDTGSYFVVVSNQVGQAISDPSVLTVYVPVSRPRITSQPASQTVGISNSVTFSVTASGTGPLSYQWQKDRVTIPGATFPQLTLSSVLPSDAGRYSVIITNVGGRIQSRAARLTVLSPAMITLQPVSQSVSPGTKVIFKANAKGAGPLHYQWYRNGSPLNNGGNVSGATRHNLVVANVTTADAGTYWVVVSNPGGKATSAIASLTINSGSNSGGGESGGESGGEQDHNDNVVSKPNASPKLVNVMMPPPRLRISANQNGGFILSGVGIPGTNYILQAAESLSAGAAWSNIATNTADTNGQWQMNDPDSATLPRRFYRVTTP